MSEDNVKRGSSGGKARAENLSKEQRKAIASTAAKARWAKKDHVITGVALMSDGISPATITIETGPAPDPSELKHCAACLAGQSLEEGEGTHVLATVEHPITLPAAFRDAEATVVVPEPPPSKPKRQAKAMPKEFRTASSYAEKRLPVAIKEKSDHVGAVARLDAEINDLVRVIKALGGNADAAQQQAGPMQTYLSPGGVAYQSNVGPVAYQLPSPYQPNAQAATQVDIPSPPRPMSLHGGGVSALDIISNME